MIGAGTFSISCKRNAGNCYEEAASVCPAGFDVLDAQGQQGAIVSSYAATGQATVAPTYNGQMLVRCRQAVATAPAAASAQANGRHCPAGPDGVYRCE